MKLKTVGGGLSQRQVKTVTIGELKRDPQLVTAWYPQYKLNELADHCRAMLQEAGLPVRSSTYVIDRSIPDRRNAWFELTPESEQRCAAIRAKGTGMTTVHGLYDGDAEEDSPIWLARQILSRILQLQSLNLGYDISFMLDPERAEEWTEFVEIQREALPLEIGEMKERLGWKPEHEPAAMRVLHIR